MEQEQTTICLPSELKKIVQKVADMEGQSFNWEIVYLIILGLEVQLNEQANRTVG